MASQQSILISPNERAAVKQAFGDRCVEYPLPYDFKLFTARGTVSAERKTNPDDLIASVTDGRLTKEFAAMREDSDFQLLVLEGKPKFSHDNQLLIGHRLTRWSRDGYRNLLRSIRYVEGIDIEFTANIADTAHSLLSLQLYMDMEKHVGLRARPKLEPSLLFTTQRDRFIYWLQGLPGVSITRAMTISEYLTCPYQVCNSTEEQLCSIPGIGPKLARGIHAFLSDVAIVHEKCNNDGVVNDGTEEE